MAATMMAARMHRVGDPMRLDEVPVPEPGPHDVRVSVRACNIVPNLANILQNWTTWFPQNPLPELPAIFGLDPAGVVDAVGSDVHGFARGDRVYVNPGRYCGGCLACRRGHHINCTNSLGVALLSLVMGVPTILGTGRDRDLLARVEALARIESERSPPTTDPLAAGVRRRNAGRWFTTRTP